MRLDYPNARGTLSAPLSKSARTVQFNADLEALLVNLLEGDWTYLLVRNDFGGSEVIKLAVELGQRVVYRAQDYTCATAFQQGDTVEYVFTTEHALVELPKFQLYVTGAATLEEYTIGYKLPSFEHVGSAEVVASGDDIILGRNSQAYGCCDGAGAGAVSIEEPYIYLTSGYYPWYNLDKFYSSKFMFTYGHEFYDRYANALDKLESLGYTYNTVDMWGGALEELLRDNIEGYYTYINVDMWGGYLEQYELDKITGQVIVVSVDLFGGGIGYTQFPDKLSSEGMLFTEISLI